MNKIKLSKNLSHTWFIDLDGSIVKHNGYIVDKEFKKKTIEFLKKNKIRFNEIMFDLPYGERILINDIKPNQNLKTSISINLKRNYGLLKYQIK